MTKTSNGTPSCVLKLDVTIKNLWYLFFNFNTATGIWSKERLEKLDLWRIWAGIRDDLPHCSPVIYQLSQPIVGQVLQVNESAVELAPEAQSTWH